MCNTQLPTCQREDGELTGEGRKEAGERAQTTRPPGRVMDGVDAAIVAVDHGYREQVHPHQKVTQCQVSDKERMDLRKEDISRYNNFKKRNCNELSIPQVPGSNENKGFEVLVGLWLNTGSCSLNYLYDSLWAQLVC